MTTLTMQGGKLIVQGTSLGTGQECCCDEERGACCVIVSGAWSTGSGAGGADDWQAANVVAMINAIEAALTACGWECLEIQYPINTEDGNSGVGFYALCKGTVNEGDDPPAPTDDMCCQEFQISFPEEEEPEFQGPFTETVCVYRCDQAANLAAWNYAGSGGTFSGPLFAPGGPDRCENDVKREDCEGCRGGGIVPTETGIFHANTPCAEIDCPTNPLP